MALSVRQSKWKKTIEKDKYSIQSAASLTIVIPWVRVCQMERTSRWTLRSNEAKSEAGPEWWNGQADGKFVDVPTLSSFAAMLAATPCQGSTLPRRLLFIDIHEYEELEKELNATGQFCNRIEEYDLR